MAASATSHDKSGSFLNGILNQPVHFFIALLINQRTLGGVWLETVSHDQLLTHLSLELTHKRVVDLWLNEDTIGADACLTGVAELGRDESARTLV